MSYQDEGGLLSIRPFINAAQGYALEYAKVRDLEDESVRRFKGIGYGHQPNIIKAILHRQKEINSIKKAASGLNLLELEQAKGIALRSFPYDVNFEIPVRQDDGSFQIKQELIVNYYDPANIAELVEEAFQIACNNEGLVKPVTDRFEAPMKEAIHPRERDDYQDFIRGERFDI